uniref:Uncharacterized protein n=1 Tax=Ciona intestinalis TaxID=7719 RepID=H2XPX3_CIOIN
MLLSSTRMTTYKNTGFFQKRMRFMLHTSHK